MLKHILDRPNGYITIAVVAPKAGRLTLVHIIFVPAIIATTKWFATFGQRARHILKVNVYVGYLQDAYRWRVGLLFNFDNYRLDENCF
jgi:hypothetical protein